MVGELALEEVYAARLDAIRPTREEIQLLSAAYVAAVEPGAVELLRTLQEAGTTLAIVSGGLREALLPLAKLLDVPAASVHAVDIVHDAEGNYVSVALSQPLSQQDGKPRIVRSLSLPHPSVMVGDGSTDAAVRGETDQFIAYTGVARRPVIVASADAEARSFVELSALLLA
jgi:phosphoserine phosphatase